MFTSENYSPILEQLKIEVASRERRQKELSDKLEYYNNKLVGIEITEKRNERGMAILQIASTIARNHIKDRFEAIVTDALRVVTGLDREFKIDITSRGDEIEAIFTIDGNPHITDSHGGGLGDIIGLVLRMLILNMHRLDCPVLLDEPTKHLHSTTYSEQIGRLLKEFSKTRQIIIATYSDELTASANRIIRTKLIEDKTVIEVETKDEPSDNSK